MLQQRQYTLKMIVLAVFVAFLTLATIPRELRADSAWQAKYWNNRNLTGTPVLQRHEDNLNHDWGDGSPAPEVNVDNFSAEWTRTINVSAGMYRFTATMDDGMRVWVDNALIIDSWYDSQAHTISADVYLAGGDHHLRVAYYEAGGGAIARLTWSIPAGAVNNWRAEYYNNTNLSGLPVLVRDDAGVNFDWGNNSPASGTVNADRFSVRWTRSLSLEPGRYRFTVIADDGARLWVNDNLIIDQWRDQVATTYTAEVDVAGTVPIRVEYYEQSGLAQIQLSWTKISAAAAPPVPGSSWQAQYFSNESLSGPPAVTRSDPDVDFIWGSSSPVPNVIGSDHFSVRWSNTLNLPAGRYNFTARVDGGVRVWVNERLIIDQWIHNFSVKSYTAQIELPGGNVPVRVEYFEDVGLAEIHLDWVAVGAATSGMDSGAPSFPSGSNTATMTGARYLNVRSGPGLKYEPFTFLSQGQTVELTGYRDASTTWIQIILPGGRRGWVSARFLSSSIPFTDLAVWSE